MVAVTAPVRGLPPAWRIPLLVLGFACLAGGVAGGIARTLHGGPLLLAPAIALHGPLMVCGFFGTVIALERAVALERGWAYLAPLASGSGGIAVLAGWPVLGLWLFVVAAAILTVASVAVVWRRASLDSATLTLAAGCWLVGNLLLALGAAMMVVLGWWIAFFALTIGAERLELSRYVPRSAAAQRVFLAIVLALVAGGFTSLQLSGLALCALAAWLGAYDIAWKTVRGSGLPRYIAICLLAGYAWLALGGAMLAAQMSHDAAVHALLVGFVFSMVFGHAPVIVPAVLRRALPYTPLFYVPLALLHASLALRVAGGLAAEPAARIAGSAGNMLAIAVFIAVAATQALRSPARTPLR